MVARFGWSESNETEKFVPETWFPFLTWYTNKSVRNTLTRNHIHHIFFSERGKMYDNLMNIIYAPSHVWKTTSINNNNRKRSSS